MIDTLQELFDTARLYGKVYIHTCNDGYYCNIAFHTISHVSLEAKSDYNHKTVAEALIFATDRAKAIATEISNQAEKLKLLSK